MLWNDYGEHWHDYCELKWFLSWVLSCDGLLLNRLNMCMAKRLFKCYWWKCDMRLMSKMNTWYWHDDESTENVIEMVLRYCLCIWVMMLLKQVIMWYWWCIWMLLKMVNRQKVLMWWVVRASEKRSARISGSLQAWICSSGPRVCVNEARKPPRGCIL
jgi:hypothetical protein